MVNGTTKLYITKNGNAGEVIFTTTSTNGKTVGRHSTTIFGVTCKGYLTVQLGSTTYDWRGADDATKLYAAGSFNDTIVLLPKAARTALGSTPSRRSYATGGRAPRCNNAPAQVIAALKASARGNDPNGCGPANGIGKYIPNWNFKGCCDNHDNCYDDCSQTFETCNDVFHGCMRGKCDDVWDSWEFWVRLKLQTYFGQSHINKGALQKIAVSGLRRHGRFLCLHGRDRCWR